MAFGIGDLTNIDDVKDVWNNLEEKNWQGLLNAIRRVRDEKGNNQTLDKLEECGQRAKAEGRDFPDNPAALATFVKRET